MEDLNRKIIKFYIVFLIDFWRDFCSSFLEKKRENSIVKGEREREREREREKEREFGHCILDDKTRV